MIEREILKDIKSYKPKLVGGLTARQFFCSVLGVAVTIPTFLFCNQFLITEAALFISGCCGVPFFACGWKEVYDMPFEKFAVVYIRAALLCPRVRKYKTDDYYDKWLLKHTNPVLSKKEQKQLNAEIKALGKDYEFFE